MGKSKDFTPSVDDKAAGEIFGRPENPPNPPASPNQIARPTSIHEIVPDPKQPRRQIPSVIRQQWDGSAENVAGMFGVWAAAFAEESGRQPAEIEDVIDKVLEGDEVSPAEVYQGEQADPKRHWGVIGGSLMAVVNLAAEIRRDGLTNPITVVPVGGNQFVIETGERRWLAFHLLNIFYPDSVAWERIPARAITASSVWRQASENTARAQLNAISMARQEAILLMDLYGNERFQSYDELVQPGQCDRAYYAQVADGNVWRVPRGKGELLVGAMGIKNPDMLRRYRDLLRLPDEIWMLADDLNWEEGFIRTRIIDFASLDNVRIAKARQLADEAGYRVTDDSHTVPYGTVSDEVEGELGSPDNPDPIDYDAWNGGVNDAALNSLAENTPAPTTDGDDEPVVDSSLEFWAFQALEFAHERAVEGRPWFAAMDSPSNLDRLNQLIDRNLLRGSSAYTNTYSTAAHYAISGQGCAAIGKPFIATPNARQRRPVSGGEFHAGSNNAGGTPPNSDLAAEQRKREQAQRSALNQMRVMPDLITSNMKRVRLNDIDTAAGREEGRRICDATIELLRAVQEQLSVK